MAEWLEAIHVGQTGGVLNDIISRRLSDKFFGIFLNPGHQIQLDEWVNSPVWPGSKVELRSGMAMQVDIIPATGTDYFTSNIEDGIAIGRQMMEEMLKNQEAAKAAGTTAPHPEGNGTSASGTFEERKPPINEVGSPSALQARRAGPHPQLES